MLRWQLGTCSGAFLDVLFPRWRWPAVGSSAVKVERRGSLR